MFLPFFVSGLHHPCYFTPKNEKLNEEPAFFKYRPVLSEKSADSSQIIALYRSDPALS